MLCLKFLAALRGLLQGPDAASMWSVNTARTPAAPAWYHDIHGMIRGGWTEKKRKKKEKEKKKKKEKEREREKKEKRKKRQKENRKKKSHSSSASLATSDSSSTPKDRDFESAEQKSFFWRTYYKLIKSQKKAKEKKREKEVGPWWSEKI
jgi:hypothetical protein